MCTRARVSTPRSSFDSVEEDARRRFLDEGRRREGRGLAARAGARHAAVPVIASAWAHAANNGQRLLTARALLPVRTVEATTLLTTWAAEKKAVAPVLKKHLALLAH